MISIYPYSDYLTRIYKQISAAVGLKHPFLEVLSPYFEVFGRKGQKKPAFAQFYCPKAGSDMMNLTIGHQKDWIGWFFTGRFT
jgi:hypothetical protein